MNITIGVLNHFGKYFHSENSIKEIDRRIVLGYTNYLHTQTSINEISINTLLRGIRALFYYAMELGYLDRFKIQLIKTDEKIKEIYTDEEIAILLKKPDIKKCEFYEYRTWVMTNYLVSTGNRISTVINLKIEDIDIRNREIALRMVKNRKQQIIPMSSSLSLVLSEYIRIRKGDAIDYLFCDCHGNQLTRHTARYHIVKYNTSRGINKTSIHLYRNYFAKCWILSRWR